MSSAWTQADGSEEGCKSSGFEPIPDNTYLTASIKEIKLDNEYNVYQAKWQVVSNNFKNRIIFQKFDIFSKKEARAKRHANLLKRLFMLSEVPFGNAPPTDQDFYPLQRKIFGLKVQCSLFDGKDYNWVSEIHVSDRNFNNLITGDDLVEVGQDVPF